MIYACEEDAQGCLVETEDDGAFRDLACQMGADGVHRCCRADCQPGQSRCNGAFVEVCLLTGEGCADWIVARDCAAAGEGCEASDDGAQCTGEAGCIAECWTGETRCTGDTVEHCVDAGDGCLVWALGTDCADPDCADQCGG